MLGAFGWLVAVAALAAQVTCCKDKFCKRNYECCANHFCEKFKSQEWYNKTHKYTIVSEFGECQVGSIPVKETKDKISGCPMRFHPNPLAG